MAVNTTVAVIQARMGSTRTPGKVLKEICGQPMLWHQIQRVKLAKSLSKIIVATTNQQQDQAIVELARSSGVEWSTGSTHDVLDRFYQAVKGTGAEVVVRLTGDCPLIDPVVIDQVVEHYQAHSSELDHICLGPDWPEGYDTEAFSFSALEQAWNEATKEYEREHVTPYVTMSGKFRVHHLPCPQNLSDLRLTVDEPEDFEVVKHIYEALYPENGHGFGLSDILALHKGKPQIFTANMNIQRNEGFLKSLKAERKVLRYDSKPTLKHTNETWNRAERVIPAGTQTLSKGPSQFVQSGVPKYLQKGYGSRVWDVDGNEYIDYPMGLGSVILGHSYPRVNEAIHRQLQLGQQSLSDEPIGSGTR